jgi:hypothetical protein
MTNLAGNPITNYDGSNVVNIKLEESPIIQDLTITGGTGFNHIENMNIAFGDSTTPISGLNGFLFQNGITGGDFPFQLQVDSLQVVEAQLLRMVFIVYFHPNLLQDMLLRVSSSRSWTLSVRTKDPHERLSKGANGARVWSTNEHVNVCPIGFVMSWG